MKCPNPKCPGDLRQYHSYTVGTKRFSDWLCEKCRLLRTTVTMFHHGEESAYLLAKKEREKA